MPTLTLYPAIDLRHGRVVRLAQGQDSARTDYGDDPVLQACRLVEDGAAALHVVDLDAAFGDGSHGTVITEIARTVPVPIQVGGGIRDDAAVDAFLRAGVARVIIGSAAVERPAWVASLIARHGAARVIVGLDARDGVVRTRGWLQGSGRTAGEVGAQMFGAGVREVVHTDISRDGMLGGANFEGSLALARDTGLRVIVSGGAGSLEDIRAVSRAAAADPGRLVGIVFGRALYERRFTLRQALEAAAVPC